MIFRQLSIARFPINDLLGSSGYIGERIIESDLVRVKDFLKPDDLLTIENPRIIATISRHNPNCVRMDTRIALPIY